MHDGRRGTDRDRHRRQVQLGFTNEVEVDVHKRRRVILGFCNNFKIKGGAGIIL